MQKQDRLPCTSFMMSNPLTLDAYQVFCERVIDNIDCSFVGGGSMSNAHDLQCLGAAISACLVFAIDLAGCQMTCSTTPSRWGWADRTY